MTEENSICPVCNEKLISGCRNEYKGGGIILKEDSDGIEYAVPCKNMIRIGLKRYMQEVHPLLLEVPPVRDTPLYKHKELDRTKDNLFFSSVDWGTFLAHLKWVLGYKYFAGNFVKVVTDMTLLNIYVGNASIRARLKSQIEEDKLLICNSLEDLLESPDLVVVRLGYITHFNRAAANVLQEAINIRRGKGKPTWLVEPPNKAFQPFRKTDFGGDAGMPCCSDEVLNYVQKHFETLALEAVEGVPIEDASEFEMAEDTIALEDSAEFLNETVEEEAPLGGPSNEDVDDLVGPDRSKKRNYSSWKKKR